MPKDEVFKNQVVTAQLQENCQYIVKIIDSARVYVGRKLAFIDEALTPGIWKFFREWELAD